MRRMLTTLALLGAAVFTSLAMANNDEALTCTCPDNLLVNPSFEGSTLGWLSSGGNFYYGSGYQVCGANNGFLEATSSNAWFWQQVSNIDPGDQIDLTFWAGTHRPSYNHFIRLAFFNSSDGFISGELRQIDYDVDDGNDLQFYSISAVAPAGTNYLRVEGFANGDYIKIDQVCLNKTACDLTLECEKNINGGGWSTDGDCSIHVCVGDHVSLSVSPNGLASYEWEGPGGFSFSSTSTSDAVIANDFALADAGIYSVTATDAAACTASTSFEVGLNSSCLPGSCINRVVSNTSGCLESSHYGFWLEGIPYSFENGASLEEFSDGTALLTGRVNANDNSGKWFDVYAVFTGRTSSIPIGSPKWPDCYTPDTENWYYYTGLAGYIEGSEGAFNLSKRGEPFQVGKGANLNENVMGASGWFDAEGLNGDFNVRLNGNEGDPCTCNNVTSGGTVGVDQEGCGNPTFDPGTIVNKTAPSGGTGTIEYIWIKSTTSCVPPPSIDDPNWSIISGATSHSYNPGPISETTCFVRCSRREGCDDYVGESNVVTITVLDNCLDPPGEEVFACGDGVKIDVLGVGDECEPTSSISVPGTEFQNVVEITYKNNSQGDHIEIDVDGTAYQLPQVESAGIYVYRGLIPGNANTIVHDPTNSCKYQSMVVYAFRNTTENLTPSMQFTDGFKAYNNIKTFSIPLATDSGPRNVTIKLPISEMTNDGRYLLAKAEAGGVEAQTIIYGPDLSLGNCCLNIVMLTLNDVPGSATSVDFTIDTRNGQNGQSVNGQSYIIAGGVSVSGECFECDAVIEQLAFYDTDANTLGATIVNNGTYNSSELPLNFNIEAVVSGSSASSVVFTDVSGNMVGNHTENTVPYRYKLDDIPLGLGAGTYTIKAKAFTQDNGGGVACDEVTLTFTIVCDLTVNAGNDEEICAGESVTLTASASNEVGNVSYSWNTGATTASITVSPDQTETYTVTVLDGRGCQDADNVKVVVNDRPQANLSAEDASCGSTDGSITITFPDHPTRTNIEFSLDGGTSYQASVPDNSESVAYSGLAPGTYQVWARWGDDDCPTDIGSVTVGEDPEPSAVINGGGNVCAGDELSFSAVDQGAGVSYNWDFGPNANPATASGKGPHNVVFTLPGNQVGNVNTSVNLTVSKANCADDSQAPVFILDTPEATVSTENPTCGENNGTITFSFPDNPDRTTISFSINGGASFPYSVNDNSGTFTVDGLSEGSFDLAARWGDGACATDLGNVTLTNQDGPSLTVGDDVAICLGESTTLSAQASGGTGDLTITWSTGSNASSITVTPDETTTYSVTVEDENGCKATGEVTVTVNPVPTVSVNDDQSICEGQILLLTASASGGTGAYEYEWSTGATTASISVQPSVTTTYSVEVTDENGCKGTASVTITVDEAFCASLGDYVWEDTNGNGIQDDGDTGVEGVTVNLKDESGTVIETTTTGPDGSYSFDGLAPGTYSVQFELPNGFTYSPLNAGGDDGLDSDADPAQGGMTATTTLESGDNDPTLDAGIYETTSLGDYVWEDLNGNGIQDDGDTGVEGVTVNLKDESGMVIETTTTGPDGSYSFDGLAPGTYSVQFELPNGFTYSPLNAGGDDGLDSDADPAQGGMTATTTLESGDNDPTLDAGIYETTSLGDYVWEDLNGNGIQDDGDTGVEGVTVNLKDESGTVIETTTTGPDGSYSFTDLDPGTYSVQFELPVGFKYSPLNAGGDDSLDSDADPAQGGMTATTTLESGDNDDTLDAGIYETTSLGDYVWEDLNGNGIQDDGDTGVEGVTVNLKDESGTVIETTTIGPDGSYSFTDLDPGTYSVQFELPVGFKYSPLNVGGNDSLDSDADPAQGGMTATTTLESGDNDDTLDAGIYQPASLGDYVWEDLNGNGIQDDGDTGVEGVTVNLKDESGTVIATTTTSPDGSYSFEDLDPGTYSVQFELPAGFKYSPLNAGGDDTADSDADPAQGGMIATTTLESGDSHPTLDAGIYQPASLGDYVWEDLNGNGIQDDGDTGVEGVRVNLKDESGTVIETTTTGPDGSYSFDGLAPGTYSVQFVLPSGFTYSPLNAGGDDGLDSDADPAQGGMTATTTLESGDNDPTLDAGIYETTSLGDYVWEDLNGNGIQDDGDTGVEGVTVNLKDESGAVIATTTTGPDGSYSFTDLDPGTYSVQFELPAGFKYSPVNAGGDDSLDSDADPAQGGMTATTTLESGDNDDTLDAGIYETTSLGDYVWEDLNGNGIQDDGDTGVEGVTVNLKDESGAVIATTTTGPDGSYSFEDLDPGTYSVQFELPAGFKYSPLNVGGDDSLDSDADPAQGGMTATTTLESGDSDPTLDAGVYQPASLGDYVWEDLNGNGIQDDGDTGVQGVTVNLKDESGTVIATTTTGPDGSYSFEDLDPGIYSVQFEIPDEFEYSPLNASGDDTADSDADPAQGGMTATTTLESGDHDDTFDAGIYETTSLGDYVWEDLNGNGIQDDGDTGVEGVRVNLKDESGAVIETTTTGPDGSYSFDGLAPGTYSVQFVLPSGFTYSPLNAGGDDGLDSDADPTQGGMTATTTLESGDKDPTLDAGIYETTSLGDYVWEDLNGNGIQDDGDTGVEGVTVNLKDESGAVIATTTTGPDGSYSFTDLDPGTYSVQFELPAGFKYSPVNAGGDDSLDSDADPAQGGMTATTTLESGDNDDTLDAGIYETTSLGDYVWEDLNGNGIQDDGDTGVEGVTVNLKDESGAVIATTTTGPDGSYSFEDLDPGTYSVQFELPAGFKYSPLNVGGDDSLDSDADPAQGGMTATTTLESGDSDPTLDAGVYQPASLGDYVWEDLNGNGIQDDGDTGVQGVTVNLKDESGTVIATTTTGPDGSYSFEDLDPGIYSVQFEIPDEFEYSPLNASGDDTADSDADPAQGGMTATTTLESGDHDDTFDAGIYETTSLGDYVWEDLNGNGIQDDGDTGVEGVTVNLKDESGTVIETTTTGPDGSYSFDGLAPGTYSVQFELPNGFTYSPLNAGGDDGLDSDADPAQGGMTATTTLESGDNDPTLDAGIYETTSLGDYVWEDLNGNGIQDDGDTGVEGVTVNLKDESGTVIETTTTGPDGSYSFTDLAPGTYSVQFELPAGFKYSPVNAGGDDAADSDADPAQGGMTATTTLESGDSDPTLDAGIYQPASLGDYVWEDLNGNGIQDDGDTGVEGVTVNLKDESGTVIATTTTGPDGSYSFEDLDPGTYSVQFEIPDEFEYSPLNVGGDDTADSDADPAQGGMTATTTLESGDSDPTLDAGIYQPASLGDYVWEDLNGNGIQDDGDTGVEGVTVNLKDESGTVIATTTTGPDGSYSFEDLDPGTYSVQFELPNGFTYSPLNASGDDTADSDADPAQGGMTATTTLESGDSDPTLDAGIYQPASLGDYVWEDLNGNGIQDDGDTGVEGVRVNLKDESGTVIETTTTGPDGSYSFDGLAPGTYSVQFELPNGFTYSPLNAGGDDGLDSDADPTQGGMTATTTLESGDNDPTLDAGIYETTSLGDYVWEDLNGNGIQDDGDTGVEGVTVNLKDESGTVIETTTTGPDGSYSFTDLAPGTYSVQFVLPDGYVYSPVNAAGDDSLDSDADPAQSGMTETTTLESGDNDDTLDAGIYETTSLGNYVWEDLNGNGIQDDGDTGVEGVTVNLKDESGTVIATTTTSPDGSYSFEDLDPGTYSVQFELPAGFKYSPVNAGGNDAADSDADPAQGGMTATTTLESGDSDPTLDAGIYQPASLGDYVWEDLNGNGIQDDGDTGVEGVTVNLKDESGTVIATTTTGPDGSYSFEDLDPGTYSVQFELPNGFTYSPLNAGGDDSLDSDADPAQGGMTATTTLESGDNDPTLDAGIYETTSLGDYVWEDLNGNGIQDDGDTGVEGVTVNLKDESGTVIETTTTGPDGSYSFDGLDPGTYSIQFELPGGFVFSTVNAGGDDTVDSDANPTQGGMTATTTLESGDHDPTLDAGIYETTSLGDYVWEDLNGNGIQDDGDTGVEGVTVNLKDESGTVIETTTTGPDGSYSFTDLAPGTYSVQFVLPDGFVFSPVNQGDDDSLDSDADPSQDGMTATTTLESGDNDPTLDAGINQEIDLQLIKTVSDASPNVGDVITFSIQLENLGPNNATGVEVQDFLPNGYSNIENISDGGTLFGDVITWSDLTVAHGTTIELTFDATVNEPGNDVNYVNIAEVTAADQIDADSEPGNGADTNGNGDIGPLDNDGSQDENDEDDGDDATIAPQQIDLELTKTVNDATPNVGDVVTFTIQVDNLGPDAATNVAVEDVVPNGYAEITNISNGGSLSGSAITWSGLSIADGGSISLSFDATVNEPVDGISYLNVAQVTAAGQYDVDSTPDNDDGDQSEDDEDNAGVDPVQIDLELDKDVDDRRPLVGSTVSFTIDLVNKGPDAATNITVYDPLPSGYSDVQVVSVDEGEVTISNIQNVIWKIPSLAAGGQASISFSATVNATGNYTNLAQVFSVNEDDVDSTPGNGVDTDGDGNVDDDSGDEDDGDGVEVDPVPVIDLELDKAVNNATPDVGSNVVFTITVVNQGPSAGSGIVVNDQLPSGYSFVSSSAGGDYNAATGDWNLNELAVGESKTLEIVAAVLANGDYRNLAEVSDANEEDIDSTPDNGVDTDNDGNVEDDEGDEDDGDGVEVNPNPIADLALDKSVNVEYADAGDIIVFTVALTNQGPSTGTGIVVEDQLESGFTLQSATTTQGAYNENTGIWTVGTLAAGQTEFLYITVQVNNEGEYFNLAEVTAANEDDVDSTPGNGVDTDNDGDFDDDFGDEDDGDGVEVEVDCDLTGEVVAVHCDDNGTPFDPTDDIFYADLSIIGFGVGTSPGWTVTIDGEVVGGGDYSGAITTVGPFPISGGNVLLYAIDANDSGCRVILRADAPAPCSLLPCDLEAELTAVDCDDNGTGFDATDDVFYVSFEVSGSNNDSWSATVDGQTVLSGEHYNQNLRIGPFDISAGPIELAVFDDQVPDCGKTFSVTPPTACSEECQVSISLVNEPVCDDNGTPGDPSDDTFSFSLFIQGNNTAANTWTNNLGETGNFGELVSFGPYLIANGPVSFTFADSGNSICTESITVNAPNTCSDQCDLTADLANLVCDDNGTPANPNDDRYTFTLTVDGLNTGTSGWAAVINNSVVAAGEYGETVSFGPYHIINGPIQVDVHDVDNAACSESVIVTPPTTCSQACNVVVSQAEAPVCDDNGTAGDPNDDLFSVRLEINGNNGSGSWNAYANGQLLESGAYGSTREFGPFSIADGPVRVRVQDAEDEECADEITITPPSSCSEECSIEASLQNTICNDGGTPYDPSDDTYYAIVQVTGNNTGANWSSPDLYPQFAAYGSTVILGPYNISAGNRVIEFYDLGDPSCKTSLFIDAPVHCSDACLIDAVVMDVLCQDQGTADPSDDTFTFKAIVSGQYNFGNGWRTVGTDPIVNGQYGESYTFGPYLIADGTVEMKIADAQDITCFVELEVAPPASCSTPDCEVVTNVLEVLCDDNGTPTDPSDDVYTVEMSIDVANSSTAAAWTATTAEGQALGTGLFGSNATFGPFAIADGAVEIVITDLTEPNCSNSTTVEAPATCSESCAFTIELEVSDCDDNETPTDATDDVYNFSLRVEGTNVNGSTWTAATADGTVVAGGSYGERVLVSNVAIGIDYELIITDTTDPNCGQEIVIVSSPAACSGTCEFNVAVEVGECEDNETPTDATDDTYSFSLTVLGTNVAGSTWMATAADGTVIASGNYGELVVVADVAIGTNYELTITDTTDPDCGEEVVGFSSPASCSTACEITAAISNIECDDVDTADPSDDTYGFDILVTGTNVLGTGWMAASNGVNLAVGTYGEMTRIEGLLITAGDVTLTITDLDNPACSEYTITIEAPAACSEPDCAIESITIVDGPICDSDSTYTFTVLVEGGSGEWVSQDGSIAGTINEAVVVAGLPADGQVQQFLIDEVGVENCTTEFEVQAPTAGQCSICDLTANITDIICNDNGTTDPGDDTFTFTLTVTDGDLESTGWTSTGGEGFTGNFAVAKEYGPFNIQDGNINFIIASDLNPTCELAIFIPVPSTCSIDCEVNSEIADVMCNDGGTPDVPEDDMFLVNVLVTGNEAATTGWQAESLDGQALGAGAYGALGMFGPFNTLNGEVSIVFIDIMTGDCRDTLTVDPAQYCSMMIVDCPESNYYCPILEADTYMVPTDPFDCVATAALPLPVVTSFGCEDGFTVRTELINETGDVIATIEDGADRSVEGLAIGNYLLRYTVADNCDIEKVQECVLQVLDKEYPTAICVGDINVSIGSQGGARIRADQIDFGSYDNCGMASIEVRRKSMIDPVTCEPLDEPVMSDWGEYVDFTCCDANTYVTVELLVTDVNGNQNTCWLDVLVEDKIKPIVFGLEDLALDCDELPSDFDPMDSTHLVSLFGEARVFDNCQASAIEMDAILDISDCGSGTITRRFTAVDQVGNESAEVFEQVITLSYGLNYEIGFPQDTETDCIFNAGGLTLNKLGCDSLTVTYVDEFLPIEGGECANVVRTYLVINHCEWDGQSPPVVISRDEDCDNLEGNEPVFVMVREGGAFVDRDNDENNALPLAGTKGENCDNTTNPDGYWREVTSNGYWQYSQQIKIFDTTAPVIEFTQPDPVCTEELDCEAELDYPFTVTESCLTDQLQFTLELDAFADGTIDADLTDQNLIAGTYPDYVITGADFPVGNHQFELTIQDVCGNVANVSLPFSVVDCYVPEPNCFDGFEAVLEALSTPADVNGDGIIDEASVEIFAAELASCNVEDCTAPLRFSVNRVGEVAHVDQTSLVLTCEDRYRVTVEVYVWDNAFNPYAVQPDGTLGGPNYKYCTAEVILTDPNEVCNDCEDELLLEGNVRTAGEQTVEDVSIILEGPVSANTNTVTNGNFAFVGMEANGTYTLRPFKDGDDRNGITTLDILLIQAHLLGANTLDTPYKLIAADVNNSGTITALDVLELRALLLEHTESFASNTSWRFVDSQFEFPVASNPWATTFPESITTTDLSTCQFDLDFVAVKVGDVNGTAKTNRLMTTEDRSRVGTMGFELKDQLLRTGKRYTVDFKTTDLSKVLGYQFALYFDPAALALEEVQYGIAQAEHFGLSQVDQGILLTSWNHETLAPEANLANARKPIVFSLVFTAKKDGYLHESLAMATRGLLAEGYDVSKDKLKINLGFDTGIFLAEQPVLYQNFPNPFRERTLINFDLPAEAGVRVDVQDMHGRVVKTIAGKYSPGQHSVEVLSNEVPLGILYYSLHVNGEYVKTKKMIRIE